MAHRIKWDDLQFVLAVAENGSLSGAARELGVNHATVLRRIGAFEESYGVQLFERQPNGYLLTSENKDVLATLRSISNSVAGLERSITGMGTPFEGKIRITSTDTICQEILTPHIENLRKLHPLLEIELLSTNYRLDLSDLDADITIRPTSTLPDDLVGKKIADMWFRIYATPQYWLDNQSADVSEHTWLGVSDALSNSPVGKWQTEMLLNRMTLRSDSFLTLRQFAERGLGCAALPCFIVDEISDLVLSPNLNREFTTGIWVATHRDLAETTRIQALIDYFIDALNADIARFSGQPGP